MSNEEFKAKLARLERQQHHRRHISKQEILRPVREIAFPVRPEEAVAPLRQVSLHHNNFRSFRENICVTFTNEGSFTLSDTYAPLSFATLQRQYHLWTNILDTSTWAILPTGSDPWTEFVFQKYRNDVWYVAFHGTVVIGVTSSTTDYDQDCYISAANDAGGGTYGTADYLSGSHQFNMRIAATAGTPSGGWTVAPVLPEPVDSGRAMIAWSGLILPSDDLPSGKFYVVGKGADSVEDFSVTFIRM